MKVTSRGSRQTQKETKSVGQCRCVNRAGAPEWPERVDIRPAVLALDPTERLRVPITMAATLLEPAASLLVWERPLVSTTQEHSSQDNDSDG